MNKNKLLILTALNEALFFVKSTFCAFVESILQKKAIHLLWKNNKFCTISLTRLTNCTLIREKE